MHELAMGLQHLHSLNIGLSVMLVDDMVQSV
jgi:hypothetical protein